MKIRIGNKQNSALTGEWCKHIRAKGKKINAKIRRAISKKIIKDVL